MILKLSWKTVNDIYKFHVENIVHFLNINFIHESERTFYFHIFFLNKANGDIYSNPITLKRLNMVNILNSVERDSGTPGKTDNLRGRINSGINRGSPMLEVCGR